MFVLEILSPLPLTRREDGAEIFDLWKLYLPQLLPDFYGNWEPIDRVFDPQNVDAVLDQWKWPFLAVKTAPSMQGSVWMRKGTKQQLHATVILRMEPAAANQSQLLGFLKAASLKLKADFGCIHSLTPIEYERGRINKTVMSIDKLGRRQNFFVTSKELQRRLPELYWAPDIQRCSGQIACDRRRRFLRRRCQTGPLLFSLLKN
jgi:hypothetical protein